MSAVNDGSIISCSCGDIPIPFDILPIHDLLIEDVPGGNIMDFIPFVNIVDFGICTSIANPAVLAILIFTGNQEGPCIPIITTPWMPGSFKVQVGGSPAILTNSTTICVWAGEISFDLPLAFTVTIN